jgi:hypothetical protein
MIHVFIFNPLMEYGGHTQNKAFCGIPFISENRPSENLAQAAKTKTFLRLRTNVGYEYPTYIESR